MATKKDLSADEWTQLQHGLAGTALLVSVSDPGLFDSFKKRAQSESTTATRTATTRANLCVSSWPSQE